MCHDSQQSEARDAPAEPEALDLLVDHGKPVWHLFDEFERVKDCRNDRQKMDLVTTICREISANTGSLDQTPAASRKGN